MCNRKPELPRQSTVLLIPLMQCDAKEEREGYAQYVQMQNKTKQNKKTLQTYKPKQGRKLKLWTQLTLPLNRLH